MGPRSIQEQMMQCPASRLRKPADILETELNQLRGTLTEEHRRKRVEARKARRLQRKCRVKGHENVEELLARYGDSEYLQALPDLVEKQEGKTSSGRENPAKDFFVEL